MSRIGKAPIVVPAGVTVTIKDQTVSVKGPKGQLSRVFRPEMSFQQEGDKVAVLRKSEDRMARSLHGLSREVTASQRLFK